MAWRKLTQTAPQATAELNGQIAILLQELRTDLVQRNALDAHILGGGVAIGVALLVGLGPPDGIVGGQRRDDGVASRENGGGRRGAEQRGEDGLSDDAHCEYLADCGEREDADEAESRGGGEGENAGEAG